MKPLSAVLLLVCSLVGITVSGVAVASYMAVSLDDILLLSRRGVSSQTILVFAQSRDIDFTLDADDIDRLLQAGVNEEVIRYLVQRTAQRRTYASLPVTFVNPYPAYYYTPYYSGSLLYSGYSAYPYYYYGGYHYGSAYYDPRHHSAHRYPAHNRHRVSHRTPGVSHTARHDGAHTVASAGQHRSGGIGHNSSGRAGHGFSSGHHSSASTGHGSSGGHHSSGSSTSHGFSGGRHSSGGSAGHGGSGFGHGGAH